MRRLIPLLRTSAFGFSSVKISSLAIRNAILQKQIRGIISIEQAIQAFDQNKQQIEQIGKTVFLEFLNEFYMDQRITKCDKYKEMFRKVSHLSGLNLYEQGIRLSIFNKMKIYFYDQAEREELDQIIDEKIQECIQILRESQVSFSEALNMLFIYQIYNYPKLIMEILRIIDSKIAEQNMSDDNYAHGWAIFFTQISKCSWQILSEFHNITRYICEDSSSKHNENNTPMIIRHFNLISQLKLHLVGPKKIPKYFNEATNILAHRINQLSAAELCRILKAYYSLPATFNPDFRAKIVRRLLSFEKSPLVYTFEVPIDLLSEQQVEYIFPNKQTYEFLWKYFIYYTESDTPFRFFKGKSIKIMKELIEEHTKEKLSKHAAKIGISRLISAGRLFVGIQNDQVVEKIRSFCFPYLHRQLRNTIEDFSYLNIINILHVYSSAQYQDLRDKVKKHLYTTLKARSQKIRFNNHSKNMQKAISQNINSDNPDVKEIVLYMMNQFTDSSQNFNFQSESKVFFALLACKNIPHQEYKTLKKKFASKLKKEDFKILADYFLLEESKDPVQIRNMVDFLVESNSSLELILDVISSISASMLMNSRGSMNPTTNHYLQRAKINFPIGMSNIHVIDRAHSILSNFSTIKTFTDHLYLEAFEGIYNEIMEENWVPREDSCRVYVDLLLKAQLLFHAKMNSQAKKNILQKIYSGLTKLMKFDHEIYLKARYTEFVIIHKQLLEQKEGIQIEKLHKIQKALRITTRPHQISLVHLITLKLYCLGYEDISGKDATEYAAHINSAIIRGKLNLLTLKDEIQLINQVFPLSTLPFEAREKIRGLLIPLIMKSLQLSTQSSKFPIIEPILKFLFYVRANEELSEVLNKIQVKYLTPSHIVYLLMYFPANTLKGDFLDSIMDIIVEKVRLFDKKIFTIIYYFEYNLQKVPEKLSEAMYKEAETELEVILSKTKARNLSIRDTFEELGYFTFYLFGCLKSARIKGNQTFDKLICLVKDHPRDFMQRKNSTQRHKFINDSILAFALSEFKSNKSKPVKLEETYRSNQIEGFLERQNEGFEFEAIINNVMVPYFLPEKETILLHLNYQKIRVMGLFKFKAEMYKLLCQKEVKVFNIKTHEIKQI